MTTEEIRLKIGLSPYRESFEKMELEIDVPHHKLKQSIKGFLNIYRYLEAQQAGWDKLKGSLPPKFSGYDGAFNSFISTLTSYLQSGSNPEKEHSWTQVRGNFKNTEGGVYLYDAPETQFLLNLYKEHPALIQGAMYAFKGSIDFKNAGIDFAAGQILACNFIYSYSNEKQNSLSLTAVAETQQNLLNYMGETEKQYLKFIHLMDDSINEKKQKFESWFNNAAASFKEFYNTSSDKQTSLEKAYNELLSLNKPAEYWRNRAEKLKKEGKSFLKWLVALVAFGCASLYFLLWLTPEGMLLSFIQGSGSAIKWSVVYVTFIALLAYGIRSLAKVMFSSFHLARDAEEREHLTLVYVAMVRDNNVSTEDRQLIMQSLFSRADTGLLKDDGNHTMPGNIVDKLSGK